MHVAAVMTNHKDALTRANPSYYSNAQQIASSFVPHAGTMDGGSSQRHPAHQQQMLALLAQQQHEMQLQIHGSRSAPQSPTKVRELANNIREQQQQQQQSMQRPTINTQMFNPNCLSPTTAGLTYGAGWPSPPTSPQFDWAAGAVTSYTPEGSPTEQSFPAAALAAAAGGAASAAQLNGAAPGATASSSSSKTRRTQIPVDTMNNLIAGPDPSDGKFTCLYGGCMRKFGRKYNIQSHIQTHLSDRPYRCDVCAAGFVRRHDLIRHVRIHAEGKLYLCPCGKGFSRADALSRHKLRQICEGGRMEAATNAVLAAANAGQGNVLALGTSATIGRVHKSVGPSGPVASAGNCKRPLEATTGMVGKKLSTARMAAAAGRAGGGGQAMSRDASQRSELSSSDESSVVGSIASAPPTFPVAAHLHAQQAAAAAAAAAAAGRYVPNYSTNSAMGVGNFNTMPLQQHLDPRQLQNPPHGPGMASGPTAVTNGPMQQQTQAQVDKAARIKAMELDLDDVDAQMSAMAEVPAQSYLGSDGISPAMLSIADAMLSPTEDGTYLTRPMSFGLPTTTTTTTAGGAAVGNAHGGQEPGDLTQGSSSRSGSGSGSSSASGSGGRGGSSNSAQLQAGNTATAPVQQVSNASAAQRARRQADAAVSAAKEALRQAMPRSFDGASGMSNYTTAGVGIGLGSVGIGGGIGGVGGEIGAGQWVNPLLLSQLNHHGQGHGGSLHGVEGGMAAFSGDMSQLDLSRTTPAEAMVTALTALEKTASSTASSTAAAAAAGNGAGVAGKTAAERRRAVTTSPQRRGGHAATAGLGVKRNLAAAAARRY